MNKDLAKRLIRAHKYQMKAFKALLPESTTKHLDNISFELKEMAFECIADFLKNSDDEDKKQQDNDDKKVKKVEIG